MTQSVTFTRRANQEQVFYAPESRRAFCGRSKRPATLGEVVLARARSALVDPAHDDVRHPGSLGLVEEIVIHA
jgi:hypothetical protein